MLPLYVPLGEGIAHNIRETLQAVFVHVTLLEYL